MGLFLPCMEYGLMGKRAFIFPGQGSQYVGMVRDLVENSVEAKEMVQMADDALGFNLSHIMFNGPEELLKQTENTQPAIFLHSVIISSLFRSFSSDMTAGSFSHLATTSSTLASRKSCSRVAEIFDSSYIPK